MNNRASFWRRPESIFTMICALASSSANAEGSLEQRSGFIECGSAHIQARAQCLENSPSCVTETLSFSRRTGRAIVPLHSKHTEREEPARKLKTLDYRASAWGCVPGKSGGHYLVVIMARVKDGCADCEYSRLYDLNGRLIAMDFMFDAAGRPRPDEAGRHVMREILGEPARQRFGAVYR
jgi:hypothetical protein